MVKRKRGSHHKIRNLLVLTISAGFIFGGVLLLWAANLKIPDFSTFEERRVAESTKIYDRTGDILLYDIHEDIKRTVVPYEDISRNIKNATVAIEDAEFYEHNGIRPLAIFRAVLIQPLRGKGIQGGSTITQQVVKNSLLTSERKISRKLKEWVLALKIEKIISKEEILTLYLNEAPYGGNIYGIEEASRAFFGKESSEITLAEAAYLAALPQAPTFYSPYGNNAEDLRNRKNLVLARMEELGFISEKERLGAVNKNIEFLPQEDVGIKAPHFVFFVRSYLEEKYGKDVVERGGLKVITTLDYDMQKRAEDIVKEYALENEEKFNASNAGLIAIDPKTGQILAMVGSRDYFDEDIDGNFNITISNRQPGSAFKPFVYATAFKKGYPPETVVFNLPTQFQTTCDPQGNPIGNENPDNCYLPVNYDGKYTGPITLRNALAQSVNIPAIKTLYLSGLSDSLQTAKDFGISSLTNINQYGLTLVLGGGEVSLLEITNAYGVFANDGVYNQPTSILSVENKIGDMLEGAQQRATRVIKEQVARQISDILSDNDARAPAFGARSYLYFNDRDVAVKTGTTNNYRDAWIIGYTPNIAVGTWAGNNDNTSMEKKVAGFIVAPMWNAFMKEVLNTLPDEEFKKPKRIKDAVKPVFRGVWRGGKTFIIDTISGKLATEYTPEETKKESVITDVHNILYWVDKKNPHGEIPDDPSKDPQFNLWEYGVRKWVLEKNIIEKSEIIPNDYDDIHTPQNTPIISILNPNKNTTYSMNSKITTQISSSGVYSLSRVDYFINGSFIGSSKTQPFNITFSPKDVDVISNKNDLRVVVYDAVLNKTDLSVVFTVR